MSTVAQRAEPVSDDARDLVTDFEPRTYRGSALEELLPKIRAELGPDALVMRQREGLQGGVGGFFQRRCVEVVARRATPRVNVYDDGPAADELPAAQPAPALAHVREPQSPAIREIMRVASPFVEQLHAAQAEVARAEEAAVQAPVAPEPEAEPVEAAAVAAAAAPAATPTPAPAPAPAPAPLLEWLDDEPLADEPAEQAAAPVGQELERIAPAELATTKPAPRTGAAAAHERALVAAGIAPALAQEILASTISHGWPFAPNRALKHLVRDALAARIPVTPPVAAGRRTVVFVGAGGAGKTTCATRLADAYAEGSDLAVRRLDLTDRAPAEPAAAGHVLTVADTAAVSPASGADARALARQLRRLGPCEVHVAVPATLSASAVRRLLDGLAAVKPAAIVLTHLDEVDHAGPVIDAVIARGLALSYCSDADGLAPADPAQLAARVLP